MTDINTTDFHTATQNPSNEITPQQAAEFLEALARGETAELPAEGGAPSAAPAANVIDVQTREIVQPAPAPAQALAAPAPTPAPPAGTPAQQTAVAEDPANTVVMAKDGVHTIDYQVLANERRDRAAAQAALAEAQNKLAAYEQQAQVRASAGAAPTATDIAQQQAQAAIAAGVSADVFGDWSPEAMAKGVQQLVQAGMGPLLERIQQQDQQLQALQTTHVQSAKADHYNAIYQAHPDADSIVQSRELQTWIGSKPSYLQGAMREVLTTGSAQDVNAFFSQFKSETGRSSAPAAPAPATTTAATTQVAQPIPNSLSEFPTGVRGPGSLDEALQNLDGAALVEAMAGWTQAQRDDYINRNS